MDDVALKSLADQARRKVTLARIGSMHSIWEVIFDADALVAGKRPFINDRDLIEKLLKEFVDGG